MKSRIGQSVFAAIAALMLTATAVGAAAGPVRIGPQPMATVPAALAAALLSSQA